MRRVRFAVEVDGQNLAPQAAKAEAAPVHRRHRQRPGNPPALGQRESRSSGASASTTAGRPWSCRHRSPTSTGRDVTLGAARMLGPVRGRPRLVAPGGLDAGAGGRRLLRAPRRLAVPRPTRKPRPGRSSSTAVPGVLALAQRESPGGLAIGFLSALTGSPSVHARFRPARAARPWGPTLRLGGRVLKPGQTIALDPVWLSVEENRYDALERYGDAVAALAPPAGPHRGQRPVVQLVSDPHGDQRGDRAGPRGRSPPSISSRWVWT